MRVRRVASALVILFAALFAAGALALGKAADEAIALAGPFHTRSPWQFTATQGNDIPDPIGLPEGMVPGPIRLCISAEGGKTCQFDLGRLLELSTGADIFSQPHYLLQARIVRPRADTPLLLVQFASLHSGDSDQRVATSLLAYDRQRDRFVSVYQQQTGRNNNQEVRYVAEGPLKGAVAAAEPMQKAPFGYWITISRLGQGGRYRQVLRYRSATRYNDGNSLAAIDSEMPTIERRLGLWHPGSPPPLPKGKCAKPHLIGQELWC